MSPVSTRFTGRRGVWCKRGANMRRSSRLRDWLRTGCVSLPPGVWWASRAGEYSNHHSAVLCVSEGFPALSVLTQTRAPASGCERSCRSVVFRGVSVASAFGWAGTRGRFRRFEDRAWDSVKPQLGSIFVPVGALVCPRVPGCPSGSVCPGGREMAAVASRSAGHRLVERRERCLIARSPDTCRECSGTRRA